MNVADILLARLDRVRDTGPGRWIACCPAHEDHTPSLCVRELEDGRLLIHDFGGCDTADVLAATGLTFADLYPEPLAHSLPRAPHPFTAQDALRAVAHEALLCALVACDAANGRPIGQVDAERAMRAAGRIVDALDVAGGAP